MTGGRSTARAGWAAIVGVAIGAALLAGARDPQPAESATRPQGPSLVHVASCPDDAKGCPSRRVTSR
jgi:hypothetical protein